MTAARRSLAGAVLGVLLASAVHAGAWTPPRATAYTRFSVERFTADEGFDAEGEVVPFEFDGRYTDDTLKLYGEFALRDELALIASIPLQSIEYENRFESGATDGLGDFELGLRLRFVDRPVVVSFQALVRVPGHYEGEPRLPLGYDQYDAEGRLLLGQSLAAGRIYYGLEAAYRWRDREPADEWRYLVELGGLLTRRLYARTKLEAIESAENAEDVRDVFGNPVLRFESELRRIETTLGYRFARNLGVEVAWNPILDGRSTAKGTTWSLALVWQARLP
ncbi:MAG TPA: hypothetical protein VD788_05590 [Candidatus Polarisedimenticolaceae bacterium]|nr:hypothetical protein [Candidatus Polarisedimenticolaceae bacterium]